MECAEYGESDSKCTLRKLTFSLARSDPDESQGDRRHLSTFGALCIRPSLLDVAKSIHPKRSQADTPAERKTAAGISGGSME